MKNIPEEGEPVDLKFEAGATIWGSGGPPHATENVGDTDVVVIRVEMKKKPSYPGERTPTMCGGGATPV